MLGGVVFVIGAALFVYGVAMLADWRSLGTQWATASLRWQEWLYRRKLDRSQPSMLWLGRFGGTLAVVIGIGWMAAGVGLTTGWLK
jgi:hypothetical protein